MDWLSLSGFVSTKKIAKRAVLRPLACVKLWGGHPDYR